VNKIAFCGTRGLPPNYGGFETAVDEISKRFLTKGYECIVFCRVSHSKNQIDEYQGRQLIYVAGTTNPKLETFISSIQTGWYLFCHKSEYKHVFWFNNANFPGIILSLLAGIPITVNTDGLEWRRKKWGAIFKLYYFLSSATLSILCSRLISDSRAIQDYYQKKFKKKTYFIPYGIPNAVYDRYDDRERILQSLGLEKEKYFIQITRIEPDNLPNEIAKAFQQSGLANDGFKFVVIGYKDGTPYALELKQQNGCNGVVVLQANYDQKFLYTLRNNSFCYVHGNSVGGTNPALLEAMATCHRVMAVDVLFNRDVLGEHGYFFSLENLNKIFSKMISMPDKKDELINRVQNAYQWDAVTECYISIAEGKNPVYASNLVVQSVNRKEMF